MFMGHELSILNLWSRLVEKAVEDLETLQVVPENQVDQAIRSLSDVDLYIDLYDALIQLGRYDDACNLYIDRLEQAIHFRLGASRVQIELLEMLFPDGLGGWPRLNLPIRQAQVLGALGQSYHLSGQSGLAISFHRRHNVIQEQLHQANGVARGLENLAEALRVTGALYESEAALRRALLIRRQQGDREGEASSLYLLGRTLATQGSKEASRMALERALRIFTSTEKQTSMGTTFASLAQRSLWLGDPVTARPLADRAWELSSRGLY